MSKDVDLISTSCYNTCMKIDIYGQPIYNQNDLCELFLQDPTRTITNALVDTIIEFNGFLSLENTPNLTQYKDPEVSVKDFDEKNQSVWHMPKEYYEFDIAKWVLDQCKTEAELQRAGDELIKFQERNMFVLLQYLKYLVDTMRQNNIVWGVGRGSSVASFVLFLIGIHRINSLYYDLSIDEFLK
jgi:DNA polymerase III alpha subunit